MRVAIDEMWSQVLLFLYYSEPWVSEEVIGVETLSWFCEIIVGGVAVPRRSYGIFVVGVESPSWSCMIICVSVSSVLWTGHSEISPHEWETGM